MRTPARHPSNTSRQPREHSGSAHRASILGRPRPRGQSSVPRQHSRCKGQVGFEPLGLGRSHPSVAACEKRPAVSPCTSKPTAPLRTCSTACGQRVSSLDNARWHRGGQQALPLHLSALLKSRSGQRSIDSKLLGDLGRSVEPSAERRLARCA